MIIGKNMILIESWPQSKIRRMRSLVSLFCPLIVSTAVGQSKIMIGGGPEPFTIYKPKIKLVQVQPAFESTGVAAVVIHVGLLKVPLVDNRTQASAPMSILDTRRWSATIKSMAIPVVGVKFDAASEQLVLYLGKAVDEIPRLEFGGQEIHNGGVTYGDSVGTQGPSSFNLLGFQPTAQLTDGSTAGVYQIGLNLPFDSNLKLNGVLSTHMKDKQANIALDFFPAKNFKFQAISNQLGTSQMLTTGYERTSFSGPSYPFNYKGEVSPRFSSSTGLYFTRQLRVDSDVTSGADPGSGIYGMTHLNIPAAFDASGFMKFNLSLNLYYFPSTTADKFGVNQFESAFDLGTLVPLQRPTELKNGGWREGMWLKLGLVHGVQPGNAFGKVSGFRFDIVKSF